MNLNVLSTAAMLTISKFWLTDPVARAILRGHALGRAYREQLRLAHDRLRALRKRRGDAQAELRRVGALLIALDKRHDNKARAIYHHLLALRAGTDDPAIAAECDRLLQRFFPHDLRFITWSYLDEAGWAESMNQQMTPALGERLAAIPVGEQTLAELFRAWFEAGMELGQMTLVRNRLQATVAASGASDEAIDARRLRYRWIRTVQTFIKSLDLMDLSDKDLEALLAPLRKSIAAAESRRASPSGSEAEPDDPPAAPDDAPDPGTPESRVAPPERAARATERAAGPPAGPRSGPESNPGREPGAGPETRPSREPGTGPGSERLEAVRGPIPWTAPEVAADALSGLEVDAPSGLAPCAQDSPGQS